MAHSTRIAIIIGALVGAALGLGAVAMAAGRVLDGGVELVTGSAGRATPAFVVGQAGMYLLVTVGGALAGSVLGMVGYAVGREADPATTRFSLGPVTLAGAGIGAAVGFGAFRAMTGILGDVVEGVVTLTVFRSIVVALLVGLVTGAITAGGVERLSRPEAFGFSGEAWPANPAAFVRDAAAAVGLPILAVITGASMVYVFSQVLLNTETDVALVLFGGVAALILFGAAVVAALGARRHHR